LYLGIIHRLYIKRNGEGRKLTILLVVYGTLISGYALYVPVVILPYKLKLVLLYNVIYARALVSNTRHC
jgi:hypothetical protein